MKVETYQLRVVYPIVDATVPIAHLRAEAVAAFIDEALTRESLIVSGPTVSVEHAARLVAAVGSVALDRDVLIPAPPGRLPDSVPCPACGALVFTTSEDDR